MIELEEIARGRTKAFGMYHSADTVCYKYLCNCIFGVEYVLTRYRVSI